MKRLLLALLLTASFVGVVLTASANPAIKKKHDGKTGLEGQTVNCGYCHGNGKGEVPKKKGNDLDALRKGTYCAMKDCH